MTIERKGMSKSSLLRRYAAGERDFSNIDLGETLSLSNVDLTGINLSGANFVGTDLTGIKLNSANLSGIKLLAVNLTNANLSHTNLRGAELSGCQCIGTDLSYANFDRAILTAVVFEGANFFFTEMNAVISISNSFEATINSKGILGEAAFIYQTTLSNGELIEGPTWSN